MQNLTLICIALIDVRKGKDIPSRRQEYHCRQFIVGKTDSESEDSDVEDGEGENATEDSDDETEDELDEQDKELKKRDHVTELDVT